VAKLGSEVHSNGDIRVFNLFFGFEAPFCLEV